MMQMQRKRRLKNEMEQENEDEAKMKRICIAWVQSKYEINQHVLTTKSYVRTDLW